MLTYLSIALVWVLMLVSPAFAQYRFDAWTTDNGLPHNSIKAMLQTREAEMSLYRITQEALNNLVKHSAATEAKVTIKREPAGVKLTITDNGNGFNPSSASANHRGVGGFGLTGMAERVKLLNGVLAIHSAPGIGTTIEVTVGGENK